MSLPHWLLHLQLHISSIFLSGYLFWAPFHQSQMPYILSATEGFQWKIPGKLSQENTFTPIMTEHKNNQYLVFIYIYITFTYGLALDSSVLTKPNQTKMVSFCFCFSLFNNFRLNLNWGTPNHEWYIIATSNGFLGWIFSCILCRLARHGTLMFD
jgi:hypothetical protein